MFTRKIIVFIALCFIPAWTLGFGYFLAGGRLAGVSFFFMAIGYMATPAIATIATQRFIWKRPLRELGLRFPPWKFFFVSWLLPLFLVLAGLALSFLFSGVGFVRNAAEIVAQLSDKVTPAEAAEIQATLERTPLRNTLLFFVVSLGQVLIAGPTINALAALGEELGWRGLLHREWEQFGFWKNSVATGLLWGLWHLPLIVHGYNYPNPIGGPLMMTLLTVLLSPILTYLRGQSGSVLAAAIFHGTFNAAATLMIFLRGGNAFLTGPTGVAGMIALLGANLVIWRLMRQSDIQRKQSR